MWPQVNGITYTKRVIDLGMNSDGTSREGDNDRSQGLYEGVVESILTFVLFKDDWNFKLDGIWCTSGLRIKHRRPKHDRGPSSFEFIALYHCISAHINHQGVYADLSKIWGKSGMEPAVKLPRAFVPMFMQRKFYVFSQERQMYARRSCEGVSMIYPVDQWNLNVLLKQPVLSSQSIYKSEW